MSADDGTVFTVTKLQFHKFRQMPVQHMRDGWTGEERVARFIARCAVCNRPTWAFDDGQNDPRGPLGDNAHWSTDFSVGDDEYEIDTCAVCANVFERYEMAQKIGAADLTSPRVHKLT